MVTAAIAVGGLIVVKFAVAFVQLLGNAIDYDPAFYSNGFLSSPIGLFVGSLVLYPFPFYLAAFVALALVFPILRQSPLSTILGRAALAGAAATVVLALVGIVTGTANAMSSGDGVVILLWVVFIPLAAGVQLTAVLVAGSVVAWLWLGRQSPSGDQDRAVDAPAGDPVAETPAETTPTVPEDDPVAPVVPPLEPPISIYAPPGERD
ncbi:hypothetical protein GCM10025867_22670 [Frondihabitans sucicola]|uniref:Uncharacterized protein n=1 Tax=Frondihabitans sucicola TaxID=1268041 RepID=A0ABM8GNK9_9MICO|nr:hypothetical protein [Frondihabitans sucicola]BDZ50026.1 hypothetical protein GCM10025867_22670 [Frondihabitans sucicola]